MLGDSVAQYELGWMYAFGLGVKKNDSEAMKWFEKAAFEHEQNFSKAAASAYYAGERYMELYNNNQGDPVENASSSIYWFKRSAEGGYVKAAILLSKAYSEGLLGVKQDEKVAQYWAKIAQKKE